MDQTDIVISNSTRAHIPDERIVISVICKQGPKSRGRCSPCMNLVGGSSKLRLNSAHPPGPLSLWGGALPEGGVSSCKAGTLQTEVRPGNHVIRGSRPLGAKFWACLCWISRQRPFRGTPFDSSCSGGCPRTAGTFPCRTGSTHCRR